MAKIIVGSLVICFYFLLSQAASATDRNHMTIAEAIETADVIVVGTTAGEASSPTDSIVVETVLAGPFEAGDTIGFSGALPLDPPIQPGRRGLFLLTAYGRTYAPFHPVSLHFENIENAVASVRSMLKVWKDPSLAYRPGQENLGADTAYILGRKLSPVSVEGDEPLLGELQRLTRRNWNVVPFDVTGQATITVEKDERSIRFSFTDNSDASVADPLFTMLLRTFFPEEAGLQRATIRIEPPDEVAGFPAEEVRADLRRRLLSAKEAHMREAVLNALFDARDVAARPTVRRFLEEIGDDRETGGYMSRKARRWLIESGTPGSDVP